MKSIFKKINSIYENGIEPIEVGRTNYQINNADVETLAGQRAEECDACELKVDEPIFFMEVKDERIPSLSCKMCDNCGCALPYLLRQNIKVCKKWSK